MMQRSDSHTRSVAGPPTATVASRVLPLPALHFAGLPLAVILFAVLLPAALLLAACADAGRADDGAGQASSPSPVRVFAAASLTDAFGELALAFRADNPGVEVELNLAGSSSLGTQILSGAPADVLASASSAVMDDLVAAGAAAEPVSFATNRLQIAVPSGNPAGLTGIEDFDRTELFLGLCAQPVPCGQLADAALELAGVEPAIDTREPDVRALAAKVAAGELDAGIVYTTDVLALADELDGIDLPDRSNPEADYPIAVLTDAGNPDGAAAFVAFVTSSQGRRILAAHGFGAP